MNIESAKFLRMSERGGEQMAEVEVRVSGIEQPLKVYLQQQNGYLRVAEVLGNDADYQVDWYDNDLHQAFVDMSDRLLGDPAHEQDFIGQLKAQSSLTQELDLHGFQSLS